MTSRERVRAILNHKEADKLAIDEGAMHSSNMSAMTYGKVKEHLRITTGETRIYDVIQQLAVPEKEILDHFEVDMVDLASAFRTDESDWVDWPLPDGSPAKFPVWIKYEKRGEDWVCFNENGDVVAKMDKDAFYFDQTIFPYYERDTGKFDDLEEHMKKVMWLTLPDQLWSNADRPDFWKMVGRTAKRLYEQTDYAIVANYSSLIFEPGQWLYRNDEYFMKLLTDKNEIHRLNEKLVEIHVGRLDRFLDQVGPYVDVIVTSDDLGMQSGSLLSPDLYREMIFPYHKHVYDFVRRKADIKIFLHSCGAIFDIIPHLIEAGVDIINPVQTSATGMDPLRLKQEYGKDIVFWGGGVDTQHIMTQGTQEQVRDEVRRNCEIFMKDGGFVFNHIHNLLPGVPPANIVAMFDEANKIRY